MAGKNAKGSNAVRSVPIPESEYASVSVRKIANGYLISESTSGPKGYKNAERFSPTKPKITMPSTASKPKR